MREIFSDKAALKNDHTETSRNAWLIFLPEVDFNQFTAIEFNLFAYISFVVKCVHLSTQVRTLEKWEIVMKSWGRSALLRVVRRPWCSGSVRGLLELLCICVK